MRLHLQLTWTVYCVGIMYMSYRWLKRVAVNGVCNVDCMEQPFAEEQATLITLDQQFLRIALQLYQYSRQQWHVMVVSREDEPPPKKV